MKDYNELKKAIIDELKKLKPQEDIFITKNVWYNICIAEKTDASAYERADELVKITGTV